MLYLKQGQENLYTWDEHREPSPVHSKSGMELINKGKDKLLTGAVREAVGQSHSSLMRQGRKFISQGTVKINTFRGCSSVIGSGLGIGTSFSYSALKEKVFRW